MSNETFLLTFDFALNDVEVRFLNKIVPQIEAKITAAVAAERERCLGIAWREYSSCKDLAGSKACDHIAVAINKREEGT